MAAYFINILAVIIVIWLCVLTFYLYRTISHYKKLLQGAGRENLVQILDEILTGLKLQKKESEELKSQLRKVNLQSVNYVQKVGVLRFNPFADTGGDQSFVLAILDGNNSGIVLTSLHSREVTRWFAKSIIEGKGVDHKLSEEEEKAIKQAALVKNKKM